MQVNLSEPNITMYKEMKIIAYIVILTFSPIIVHAQKVIAESFTAGEKTAYFYNYDTTSVGSFGLFSNGSTGVYGRSFRSNGNGITGESFGRFGRGINGYCSGRNGFAVYGSGTGEATIGLFGTVTGAFGHGVFGKTQGALGAGIYGEGQSYGVIGKAFGDNGIGVDAYGKYIGVASIGVTYDFYAVGFNSIDYGSTSSRRWKKEIRPIDHPLIKISQIRGVYFNWDEAHGGNHDVGFIAEEVGKVLPEIVGYEENGIDAVAMDYAKITPLLVEAINALRMEYLKEIENLKNDLQLLRNEMEILKQNR